MPRTFTDDFYIFLTPRVSSPEMDDEPSYIKIIDDESLYAGVVFKINSIGVNKNFMGGYELKFNYDIIEKPLSEKADTDSEDFHNLLGDLILDIWDKFYA